MTTYNTPSESTQTAMKVVNVVVFIIVCAVNAVAGAGKIPGLQGIGSVSNKFNTELTPAGYAFSIWGVIYFCEAIFVLAQCCPWTEEQKNLYFGRIGWWHMLTCISNIVWVPVFCVATKVSVALAAVPLAFILVCLMFILVRSDLGAVKRSTWIDYVAVDFGFSLYAGWVTVATTLNVALGLSALGWDGSPWTPEGWTVLLIIVVALLAATVVFTRRASLYAIPVAWAVFAISVANNGETYDNPTIVTVAQVASGVVLGTGVLQFVATMRSFRTTAAPGATDSNTLLPSQHTSVIGQSVSLD